MTNLEIAERLETIAELLEAQNANEYRVRAYRLGAETVRNLKRPAEEILEAEGIEGLDALPHIGSSLARSIEQLVHTGTTTLLEQLRGETNPERVLATVPGIGPKLAGRIHEQLGVETLADLELAAHDGRLDGVPGFGTHRLRGVRESLAGRFVRHPEQYGRARAPLADQPPVSELLDVDREYREQAKTKTLPRIAPRRFNPMREAWLPVLHTARGETHYTALYSNTARAHELDMLRDWVIIYRDDKNGSGQWTVLTSQFGPLKGKRIVRGREVECMTYYADGSPSA